MAAPATQLFRARPRPAGPVRLWSVALTLLVSVGLAVGAAHVPPFIASGAELRNPDQVIYARNIWQESQTSLLVLAVFVPWLVYGLARGGTPWGRAAIVLVAALGLLLGTWMTFHSLGLYAAAPRYVSGLVIRIDGRLVTLDRGASRTYALVISDAELTAAQRWIHPGVPVEMWVAPNGQAGFIGRPGAGRPIEQK